MEYEYTDLFFEDLIRSYVDDALFVDRPWLEDLIEETLESASTRFVLITGNPGAGKTALMANLARKHPEWLRVFIRSDSQTPLTAATARAALLMIGNQLATSHHELFEASNIKIMVEQTVNTVEESGAVTGIDVDTLLASPFYSTALQVRQNIKEMRGRLTGISIRRLIISPELLEIGVLHELALLCPARIMRKLWPSRKIVILLDGLDEAQLYSGEDSVLSWLQNLEALPPNVQFVLSSRPSPAVTLLQQRQNAFLRHIQLRSRTHARGGMFISLQNAWWRRSLYVMFFDRDVSIQSPLPINCPTVPLAISCTLLHSLGFCAARTTLRKTRPSMRLSIFNVLPRHCNLCMATLSISNREAKKSRSRVQEAQPSPSRHFQTVRSPDGRLAI